MINPSVRAPISVIRRIIKLERTIDGRLVPVEGLESPGSKKKKVAKEYRPLEKLLRRSARAGLRFESVYLEKHKRSSGKKKNGFLKDLWKNLDGASRKARKELK